MNKDVAYIFIAIMILVILVVVVLVGNLFKDDLLNINKVAHFKRRNKMSNKQRIRALIMGLILIMAAFGAERIYNNSDRFQVMAEDASHYDFVDARIATKYKLEDLDYLYEVLEMNYPFFKVKERIQNKSWLNNKKAYKRLIKNTKNDAEFFVAMERILRDLNDSNLQILSGHDFKWHLKNTYELLAERDDLGNMGLYTSLRNPHVMYRYQFAGLEDIILYNENNLETKILKENEIAYMKINEMAGFDVQEEDYSKIKDFLKDVEGYDKLIIDIRGNSGGEDQYWKMIVELLTDKPLEAKYYSFFKNGHRLDRDPYKVEGATVINELGEDILARFPEEVKTDFTFYKFNEINVNPSDEIDFKGRIYLLVNEDVNSQAENFAAFAKDTGFATLVGETTGGNMAFENIPISYLRNSKFVFTYSRELVLNADGSINMETGTSPNIEIDSTIEADFSNDKAIQAVIND